MSLCMVAATSQRVCERTTLLCQLIRVWPIELLHVHGNICTITVIILATYVGVCIKSTLIGGLSLRLYIVATVHGMPIRDHDQGILGHTCRSFDPTIYPISVMGKS